MRLRRIKDPIGFWKRMKTEAVPPMGGFYVIMPDGEHEGLYKDEEDDAELGPDDPDNDEEP